MPHTPQIKTVDLEYPTESGDSDPVVLMAQLRLTGNELRVDQTSQDQDPETWLENADQLDQHVMSFLDHASRVKASLVIFPEATIPRSILPQLEEWSRNHPQAVVVAGSHWRKHQTQVVSCCPVLFRGKCYESYKQQPSPLEQDTPYLEARVAPGPHLLVFKNTPVGTLGVLVCSDFLDDTVRQHYLVHELSVLAIPSFDPKPNPKFHGLISEAYNAGSFNAFTFYCNASCPGSAPGQSAVFAQVHGNMMQRIAAASLSPADIPHKVSEIPPEGTYCAVSVRPAHRIPAIRRSAADPPNFTHIEQDWHWDDHRQPRKVVSKDNPRYKLVCFDLDGTLIRGLTFSWSAIWDFLGFDRKVSSGLFKQYAKQLTDLPLDEREKHFRIYQKWCDETIKKFASKKLNKKQLAEIAKTLRPTHNLKPALERLRQDGIRVAIVSGGIDTLMEMVLPKDVLEYFGDDIYINRLRFNGQDQVVGIEATKYDFHGKAHAIEDLAAKYRLHPSQVAFVGDCSINDVRAFARAGLSIGYGPPEQVRPMEVTVAVRTDNLALVSDIILGLAPEDDDLGATKRFYDNIKQGAADGGRPLEAAASVVTDWYNSVTSKPWRRDLSVLDHGHSHRFRVTRTVARLFQANSIPDLRALGAACYVADLGVLLHDLGLYFDPAVVLPHLAEELPKDEDLECVHRLQHQIGAAAVRRLGDLSGPARSQLEELAANEALRVPGVEASAILDLINDTIPVVAEVIASFELDESDLFARFADTCGPQMAALGLSVEDCVFLTSAIRLADVLDRVTERLLDDQNLDELLREMRPHRRFQRLAAIQCAISQSSELAVDPLAKSIAPRIVLRLPASAAENELDNLLHWMKIRHDSALWRNGTGEIRRIETQKRWNGFTFKRPQFHVERKSDAKLSVAQVLKHFESDGETEASPDVREQAVRKALQRCPQFNSWVKFFHPCGFVFGGGSVVKGHIKCQQVEHRTWFALDDWEIDLTKYHWHRPQDLLNAFRDKHAMIRFWYGDALRAEEGQVKMECFIPLRRQKAGSISGVVNVHVPFDVMTSDRVPPNAIERIDEALVGLGDMLAGNLMDWCDKRIQAKPTSATRVEALQRFRQYYAGETTQPLNNDAYQLDFLDFFGEAEFSQLKVEGGPRDRLPSVAGSLAVYCWSRPWLREWVRELKQSCGLSNEQLTFQYEQFQKHPFARLRVTGLPPVAPGDSDRMMLLHDIDTLAFLSGGWAEESSQEAHDAGAEIHVFWPLILPKNRHAT